MRDLFVLTASYPAMALASISGEKDTAVEPADALDRERRLRPVTIESVDAADLRQATH